MKYLAASDIHGSALYCEGLLEAFAREGADRLILLGDILYHGPRNDLPEGYAPKRVFAMLNPLKDRILCVRGNCDAEVDQMVLEFPVLTDHRKLEVFGHRLFLTHGHRYHVDALPDPALTGGAGYLLYGHTHVPLNAVKDGVRCLNPGSVSIPKDGSPRGYLLLEPRGITWKTLSGEQTKFQPWDD